MPTYEYQCNKCGERFDVFQSFSEEPLTKHPGKCRGKVVKVMSPAGIVFSGSGFYKTDNRSSSNSGSSTSSTKTDGGSKESSSSTNSDGSSSGSSGNSSGNSSGKSGDSSSSSKPAPASTSGS